MPVDNRKGKIAKQQSNLENSLLNKEALQMTNNRTIKILQAKENQELLKLNKEVYGGQFKAEFSVNKQRIIELLKIGEIDVLIFSQYMTNLTDAYVNYINWVKDWNLNQIIIEYYTQTK